MDKEEGCHITKSNKHFRKYIDNTTAHGVVRIFTGKSIIRRLFWLVIVLGATTGCLYNVIDRIIFLSGSPTSTTVSLTRQENLKFPAVTVCNLNQFRSSHLDSIHPNLTRLLRYIFYLDPATSEDRESCSNIVKNFTETSSNFNTSLGIGDFLNSTNTSSLFNSFIAYCIFSGRRCSEEDFVPILTEFGICFTFNSGMNNRTLYEIGSTGSRSGLQLVTSIQQEEYVTSFRLDAGIKVAIHPQSSPPRVDDSGIAVPPSRNAFISLQQRDIIDNTKLDCIETTDDSRLEFYKGMYSYSLPACLDDCNFQSIANRCGCQSIRGISPLASSSYQDLPFCNISKLCCQVEDYSVAQPCPCLPACTSTDYIFASSYSQFPANFARDDFALLYGADPEYLRDNLVAVSVYFESLNIETQTTDFAYGPVALLSDLGGQMGLFLGISVISIMEFVTWIIDELKTRCFGVKEETICCGCRQKDKEDSSTNNDTRMSTDTSKIV